MYEYPLYLLQGMVCDRCYSSSSSSSSCGLKESLAQREVSRYFSPQIRLTRWHVCMYCCSSDDAVVVADQNKMPGQENSSR